MTNEPKIIYFDNGLLIVSLPPLDEMEDYSEEGEPEFDGETIKEMIDELMGKKKRILH